MRHDAGAARCFAAKEQLAAGVVTIDGDDAKHITASLRGQPGDRLVVCDGEGTDYVCEIIGAGREAVTARVLHSAPNTAEPCVTAVLYQALPKSDKIEYIVQKCVEAGVSEIVPVVSEYTLYGDRLSKKNAGRHMDRWRRIAYEAAKQSGRGIVPKISDSLHFPDAASDSARRISGATAASGHAGLALIPYENERITTLKTVLSDFKRRQLSIDPKPHMHIAIFIGPEGGFSPNEIDTAIKYGITPVTLGPRIFRTETAGLATLCNIMYEFDA